MRREPPHASDDPQRETERKARADTPARERAREATKERQPFPAPPPGTVVPPPPPFDERQAALDARVRLKLSAGEPLDEEERAFLARLPGEKDGRYGTE